MMEFKGTQGPWKIIHGGFRNDGGFSIGSDNATASRVKVTAECWPCTIIDQEHRDELLANARLIAAAPDLLSFAIYVRDNYDCDSDAHKYGTPCRKCDAATVIAKALGESS